MFTLCRQLGDGNRAGPRAIGCLKSSRDSRGGFTLVELLVVIAIIGIYMLRTALMNCTYPLSASLMMDSVPRNQRARWQSLGSISRCHFS